MSKQLYPKPKPAAKRHAKTQENLFDRPFHVYYYDPDNPTATSEWRHYTSETAVKADAWYRCEVLGFTPAATLYSRDEFLEGVMGSEARGEITS